METKTDVAEIVRTARDSVDVQHRVGKIETVPFVVLQPGEQIEVLDDVLDVLKKQQPHPERRIGTSRHFELASFTEHVNRFKIDASVVWADINKAQLVAIYDYHAGPKGKAGWKEHRAIYDCRISPEWAAWEGNANVNLGSEEFANFIEARMDDLTDGEGMPAPVELLEMSRNLQVNTKGQFVRKVNPETGEYTMVNKEEHAEGTTRIPRRFGLALRVFEGGEMYRVESRITFRLNGGRPTFAYTLHRAAEIKRDAFNDVRKAVGEATKLVVYAGTPD